MDRRRFLQLSLAGAAGMVSGCVPATVPAMPEPSPIPASSPTVHPLAKVTPPGAAPPGTLLHNEDLSPFFVRYFKSFPAPDPAAWQLKVSGAVEHPVSLTLDQVLRELDHVEQNTRLKCVEGWSSRATWGGFTYASLASLVKPAAAAQYLYFSCADGYWEILPLAEFEQPRALFATHKDGALLPAKYGSPLRMIFPWLYGYKGAKAIIELKFQDKGGKGLWPTIGPYTESGRILAGQDYPLDLDGSTRSVEGGEITEY